MIILYSETNLEADSRNADQSVNLMTTRLELRSELKSGFDLPLLIKKKAGLRNCYSENIVDQSKTIMGINIENLKKLVLVGTIKLISF